MRKSEMRMRQSDKKSFAFEYAFSLRGAMSSQFVRIRLEIKLYNSMREIDSHMWILRELIL